jgi:hypothetical protein
MIEGATMSNSKQLKKLTKQLTSVASQLSDVAGQLDLDKLDKRLGGAADKVGLADRKKVLGVPVSRKRPDWGRIATYGAAALAAVAGARAIGGNGDGSGGGRDEGSSKEKGADDSPKKKDEQSA